MVMARLRVKSLAGTRRLMIVEALGVNVNFHLPSRRRPALVNLLQIEVRSSSKFLQ